MNATFVSAGPGILSQLSTNEVLGCDNLFIYEAGRIKEGPLLMSFFFGFVSRTPIQTYDKFTIKLNTTIGKAETGQRGH